MSTHPSTSAALAVTAPTAVPGPAPRRREARHGQPAGSGRRADRPTLPLSHVRVVVPDPAPAERPVPQAATATTPAGAPRREDARARLAADESGSLVTEYGLVAVLGATIAGIAIKWASGGAIFELLGALLAKVRVLVGV